MSRTLESYGMQVIEDDLLEHLVDFLRLSQDHIALSLNGCFLELAILQNIGNNIDSLRDVLLE